MGAQITKEQGRLPIAYVSTKHQQTQHITSTSLSIIRGNNVHSSITTNSESVFNEDFNNNIQNLPNDITIISPPPTGETSSINTLANDTISSESTIDNDIKQDDEITCWLCPHDHESNSCCHGVKGLLPEECDPNNSFNAILFSEIQDLYSITFCCWGLVKLSPNICFLYTTTCLQICCNELSEIPAEIGYMRSLVSLNFHKNKLKSIPDTIGFLDKLKVINLSGNLLTSIPASIGSLKKLEQLYLEDNRLIELPPEIGQLKTLINLDIRNNQITVLPAELGRLQYLRKLRTDGCPLKTEFVHELKHSPPSLMELAARTIVRLQIPILEDTTDALKDYLASAKKCSFCGGPYFESFVKRGKFFEKSDNQIPLEYRLCCPHWNTEQERVCLLFCALPNTAPSTEPYKHPNQQENTNNNGIGLSSPDGNNNDDGNDDDNKNSNLLNPQQKLQKRASTRKSMTIPLSSLARVPTLPTLPRSASPRPTSTTTSSEHLQQEELKKNSSQLNKNNNGLTLWRTKKNNAASILLRKPARNNSTSRFSTRWRI
nr:7947_t:CDS:2 [Entrophospora candida]CAG8617236.1 4126_t:CDS:2 [Entrophospora candida]